MYMLPILHNMKIRAIHAYLPEIFFSVSKPDSRLKRLSSFNLHSDHWYGFRKGCSPGDLLALLTDSWSSSLSLFGETFAVALDISKAIDRVGHKALLTKLPSYGV